MTRAATPGPRRGVFGRLSRQERDNLPKSARGVIAAIACTLLAAAAVWPRPAAAQILPGSTTTRPAQTTTTAAPAPTTSRPATPATTRPPTPTTRRTTTTSTSSTTTTLVITPSSTIPTPPPTPASTNGPSGHINGWFPILSGLGFGLLVLLFGVQLLLTRPGRQRRWTL